MATVFLTQEQEEEEVETGGGEEMGTVFLTEGFSSLWR